MTAATVDPQVELQRMAAVLRYDVLDTPPDGAFDRVTALAARFCEVPISTITIVDEDRIWFRSAQGLDVVEIERAPGLCASAIVHGVPYIVTNALEDPRTLDNPLVRGELGLRFYVGVPLTTHDGHQLGTLNIIDTEPREVTERQLETLLDLAAIVMDELELRRAARLTLQERMAADRAAFRDALLQNISHRMRTPLSVLHGVAQLDLREPSDVRGAQRMMRRHVNQLDALVNQYLDFATLEAEHTPSISRRSFDIGAMAAGVVEDLEEPRVTVDVRATPTAHADPDRTRQVLTELLLNALRVGDDDSPVLVTVDADGGLATVSVRDHGPGLAPPEQQRVFEKYYTTTHAEGRGVGLYVARHLAEAQGGRLDVESTRGDGACFVLHVPTVGG